MLENKKLLTGLDQDKASGLRKNRRTLLKTAWATPLVASISLPTHAETSPVTTETPATTAEPTTTIAPLPDLTITISANQTQITPGQTVRLVIDVSEINGVDADGSIQVNAISARVPSFFTFTDAVSVPAGWAVIQVNDMQWDIGTANIIPANGSVRFEFDAMASAGAIVDSSFNFLASVFGGSGGEINLANNTASFSATIV